MDLLEAEEDEEAFNSILTACTAEGKVCCLYYSAYYIFFLLSIACSTEGSIGNYPSVESTLSGGCDTSASP